MTRKLRSPRVARWTSLIVADRRRQPGLFVAWDQATFNFGQVQPGRIYRSGQMPATALTQTLRTHRIKTVLNLRGSNPAARGTARGRRDQRGRSDPVRRRHVIMPLDVVRPVATLIRILDPRNIPMLIHCAWGSERTGLVSAFAELLRPGAARRRRAQFSLRHLFVRVNDGKVMAEHLDQYESWLHAKRNAARPGQLPPMGGRRFQAGCARTRTMALRSVSPGRHHSTWLKARARAGGHGAGPASK